MVNGMNDCNHALDIIGRKLGLPDMGYDAHGVAGFTLAGDVSFYLTKVDEDELELSCAIPALAYPDAALLQAILEAHYLGAGVGGARLALDPDTLEVILFERIIVGDMGAAILERRLDDFVANAAFLMGDGSEALLDRAETIRIERSDGGTDFAPSEGDQDPDDMPIVMRL